MRSSVVDGLDQRSFAVSL